LLVVTRVTGRLGLVTFGAVMSTSGSAASPPAEGAAVGADEAGGGAGAGGVACAGAGAGEGAGACALAGWPRPQSSSEATPDAASILRFNTDMTFDLLPLMLAG
jgi:hypothetical protein